MFNRPSKSLSSLTCIYRRHSLWQSVPVKIAILRQKCSKLGKCQGPQPESSPFSSRPRTGRARAGPTFAPHTVTERACTPLGGTEVTGVGRTMGGQEGRGQAWAVGGGDLEHQHDELSTPAERLVPCRPRARATREGYPGGCPTGGGGEGRRAGEGTAGGARVGTRAQPRATPSGRRARSSPTRTSPDPPLRTRCTCPTARGEAPRTRASLDGQSKRSPQQTSVDS